VGGDPWLETYFQLACQAPLRSRQDEAELAQRAFEGDQAAQNELVETHRRLVITIAKKYMEAGAAQTSRWGRPIPASTWSLGQLIRWGDGGLRQAAERFDPTTGLSTTAEF
jgi:RNA polymerase primary sigma factor